jgi:hypothetical protein
LGSTWTVTNIPNLNARAMMAGLYTSIGNCGGLVSSNVYKTEEAPRYISSLRTNITMASVVIATNLSYSMWMRWENKRRDKLASGDRTGYYSTEGVANTKDPRFRFQP